MMTRDEIVAHFVAELTRVIGATLDTSATSRATGASLDSGFVIVVQAGDTRRDLRVYIARPGAEGLARTAAAPGLAPSEAQILAALKELGTQAVAAIDAAVLGGPLRVVDVAPVGRMPGLGDGLAFEVLPKGRDSVWVMLAGQFEPTAPGATAPAPSQTLDVIMDIDLPLVVRFGRTEVPLRTLTSLGPGSVIDLGRAPDEPVDVLISNRVVARGEVVIVAGNYGVRVQDVVSPAERARSLEAELS
jgi:flagellar motor switch protein FliN/FliY